MHLIALTDYIGQFVISDDNIDRHSIAYVILESTD